MFRQGGGLVAIADGIQRVIRVVKLGGSLLDAAVLPACLDVIERLHGQTLIVPGGGPFAEQVRIAQRQLRFDDVAAHRMAILAMQQMALLINSLKPGFVRFDSVAALVDLPDVAVWSPSPEELDRPDIAAGWDVTSDSLAAWLAGRVRADELWLVKSAEVDADAAPKELQQQGILDAAFGRFAGHLRCPITVINKDRFLAIA